MAVIGVLYRLVGEFRVWSKLMAFGGLGLHDATPS